MLLFRGISDSADLFSGLNNHLGFSGVSLPALPAVSTSFSYICALRSCLFNVCVVYLSLYLFVAHTHAEYISLPSFRLFSLSLLQARSIFLPDCFHTWLFVSVCKSYNTVASNAFDLGTHKRMIIISRKVHQANSAAAAAAYNYSVWIYQQKISPSSSSLSKHDAESIARQNSWQIALRYYNIIPLSLSPRNSFIQTFRPRAWCERDRRLVNASYIRISRKLNLSSLISGDEFRFLSYSFYSFKLQ